MTGQLEAMNAQRNKDEKLASLLSQIRTFLPSVNRDNGGHSSDYLVHPTALAHLRRRFNFVSSQLLRNDSLTDMSDRSILYFELFEWLEVAFHLPRQFMDVPDMEAIHRRSPATKPSLV